MIEAMACGTPVIAFRRGSVPEVIDDGITGFVVENEAEAVQAVSRLDELDRRTIRAVFEKRFTSTRMARDYVRCYRKLAKGNAKLGDGVAYPSSAPHSGPSEGRRDPGGPCRAPAAGLPQLHAARLDQRITAEEVAKLAEAWLLTVGDDLAGAWLLGDRCDAGETPAPTELPPDDTILSPADVRRRTGVPMSTIYREVKRGRLPKPLHPSKRRIGWLAGDIRAWQERIEEESRGPKRR